jgi:hypothetical protein
MAMDLDKMSREQLLAHLKELNKYLDNIVVLWGDKKELLETFKHVASNEDDEFTAEEVRDAQTILQQEGAFDEFIELVRDSFDRGGIYHLLSEKVSAIMQEVADRHRKPSGHSIV